MIVGIGFKPILALIKIGAIEGLNCVFEQYSLVTCFTGGDEKGNVFGTLRLIKEIRDTWRSLYDELKDSREDLIRETPFQKRAKAK